VRRIKSLKGRDTDVVVMGNEKSSRLSRSPGCHGRQGGQRSPGFVGVFRALCVAAVHPHVE